MKKIAYVTNFAMDEKSVVVLIDGVVHDMSVDEAQFAAVRAIADHNLANGIRFSECIDALAKVHVVNDGRDGAWRLDA